VTEEPLELRTVASLGGEVELVLAELRRQLAEIARDVRVEHIGATSMPDGITKGDVDVNLRVAPERFNSVIAALAARFDVAQPQNWTRTYASFSDTRGGLPLGIQVTVVGSDDDFLVELRDRMRGDSDLRRRYDAVKRANAPAGREAYWQAKNDFLRRLRNR
jgi:GrpB-like predicted nucleotidyltransferase (UPF0157 family)